ncbi:hypothetical protein [Desulfobacca acetoxidans]|uniref:Uncharacterized protein n=1 Tax=Desulfobacca acetoxidans (strain ATCC 700848 / DSM 11109 / ASRB2) TaxID=880072 RepID=F2NE27_DESAR|nr:hypothetical protein [Desulfobacca acetoxidans]AEB10595.1 hypothetical protein Desac_2788 [Desulfobacca acetoxidans DSM 11109]
MPSKAFPHTWITLSGHHLYETLNPFWLHLDQQLAKPKSLHLWITPEQADLQQQLQAALILLGKHYHVNFKLEFHAFDEEDVDQFAGQVRQLFSRLQADSPQVILDISPTTWSFVPLILVGQAANLQPPCQIIYLQYGSHLFRQRPYPLIPRQAVRLHQVPVSGWHSEEETP